MMILQHDPDVGLMHAHHIVSNFRTPSLAKDRFHFFVKLHQLRFNLLRHSNRTFQSCTWKSHGFDQQVTFFKPRHEFAAQIHSDRYTDPKDNQSNECCNSRRSNGSSHHGRVEPLDPANQKDFFVFHILWEN